MSGLFSRPQQNTSASSGLGPPGSTSAVAPIVPIAPTVTPAATMPDSESPAAIEANRRAQQAIMNRAGRTSTILTAPQNRGNSRQTDTYANRTLGGSA